VKLKLPLSELIITLKVNRFR